MQFIRCISLLASLFCDILFQYNFSLKSYILLRAKGQYIYRILLVGHVLFHVHSKTIWFFIKILHRRSRSILSRSCNLILTLYFENVLLTGSWNLTIDSRCTLNFSFQCSQNDVFNHLVLYPAQFALQLFK